MIHDTSMIVVSGGGDAFPLLYRYLIMEWCVRRCNADRCDDSKLPRQVGVDGMTIEHAVRCSRSRTGKPLKSLWPGWNLRFERDILHREVESA